MKVTFVHPHSAAKATVDLDDQITGAQVIANLAAKKWLEPPTSERPYLLSHERSESQILPTTTLATAKVQDGDVIAIGAAGKGA
jgi:hypothetical protein